MPGSEAPYRLPDVLQGRYRIGEVIGRGGASVVLQAHDELLGRDVAVKMFTARASDAQELRAQEAEARTLGALNHPGLVTLLDAGVDLAQPEAPRVFLVLELLRDADLRRHLTAGALDPVQVAFIGFDVAGALAYVHAAGIIHRDVKPANVLLVRSGGDRPMRAKLADFGVAMLRGEVEDGELATGSAAYLSPEQVEGVPLTSATDVYSLGLVLLEALTGRVAFPGSVVDAALARLEHDPEVPASVPEALAGTVRAMTARDPAQRIDAEGATAQLRAFVVRRLGGQPETASVEESRLAALRRYNLLDTPPDVAFDRITALAARLFGVAVATIVLVDAKRTWTKSAFGIDLAQVPASRERTDDGGLLEQTLVIADARADERLQRLPPDERTAGSEQYRFYAGVPLITADGHNLGVLALLDPAPRDLGPDQIAVLEDLGALVLHEMELRLAARRAVLQRDD